MSKLSLADVKDYLCIDFEDDSTNRILNNLMSVADSYLKSSVGDNYPAEDFKAKQIALLVISDLYDNRDLNEKVSSSVRKIVDDFSLQLRLELRRGVYDAPTSTESGGEAVANAES
ncbi:MAG: head-tail connector protein [Parabacteroides sp.]|nr:head-tail connector protein [Parabacteroides sp.]